MAMMKKHMKKAVSILLSILLLFCMQSIVFAGESMPLEYDAVCSSVEIASEFADSLGMSDIDFSTLKIGESINIYNLQNEELQKIRICYPLFEDNTIVAFAFQIDTNNLDFFQVSTDIVKEFNEYYVQNLPIALIYDCFGCYLYQNGQIIFLKESEVKQQARDDIRYLKNKNNVNIKTTVLKNTYDLNYKPRTGNKRANLYEYVQVTYVTQNPYNFICWAASIACTLNAIKGTNYTAVDIAQAHFGSDFNKKLFLYNLDNVINKYGVSYSYKAKVPGDGIIVKNIINGYPILANFNSGGTSHVVTVYGINSIGGYLYIMDPAVGSRSATYISGKGYSYVNASSNVTMSFHSAACVYWTV